MALVGVPLHAAAQQAPVVQLSSLNGSNGFRLDGAAAGDLSGWSVGSGDFNGDGIRDLLVGAYFASPNGNQSGSSFVMFGRSTGYAPTTNLSTLDGTTGFRLDGAAAGERSGWAVASAGDVNGDNIDDLIIGAYQANSGRGSSYVVFGRSTGFPAAIQLASLNGSDGFRLDGTEMDEQSGRSVAGAGDINGDGLDDVIIGARFASPNGAAFAGNSYVVFGRSTGFAPAIALASLNGTSGFRLEGIGEADRNGWAVSAAGDVNGDGFDDLISSAVGSSVAGTNAGSCYVVFGRNSGFAAVIPVSALDGSNGFRLDGAAAGDFAGVSVAAAGDVNNDGIADLLIGSTGSDAGGMDAGRIHVVFGRTTGFPAAVDLGSTNGNDGFRVEGAAAMDVLGSAVSAAGDFNDDGIDDVLIAAAGADPNGASSGSSYLVFGRTGGFAPVFSASALDGSNGFRLDGVAAGDRAGRSMAALGDINGDGVDDVIVSASNADSNGTDAGSSYVVFGTSPLFGDGFED